MAVRKMIRFLIAAVIVAICWFARPAKSQTPTREDLLATIRHIETLSKQTQQELDAEKQAHAQTTAALAAATKANQDTQNQFTAYQQATETEIQKGNQAITALAKVVKELHRAKWILCGLWLALCAFLALRLGNTPAVGTYLLIGVAVLAAAGCSAIWLWV